MFFFPLSQPSAIPMCYYPENHGYKTSNVVETSSGITADIELNTAFPSQRSLSRDVNKLRVEVTYLSENSLRWKVCISKLKNLLFRLLALLSRFTLVCCKLNPKPCCIAALLYLCFYSCCPRSAYDVHVGFTFNSSSNTFFIPWF